MQDDGDGEPVVGDDDAHRLPAEGSGAAARDGEGHEVRQPMAPQREWFEKDYYAVLGVPSDATEKDIAARVPQARQAVPPRREPGRRGGRGALQGGLGRERRARRRREAQGVRRGPRDGRVRRRARAASAASARAGSAGGGQFRFDDGGGLGDLLGNLFGGGGGGAASAGAARRSAVRSARSAAHDLETELHLDFLDAVHGITTTVQPHVRRAVLACAAAAAPSRARSPRRARRAAARVRSRSTRARSRSRRCAPRAAAAARSSSTSARSAGSRRRGAPARGEGAHPRGVRRRPAHPREGPRRRRAATAARPATSTSSCTSRRTRSSGGRGQANLTVHGAGHVRRGRARRAGEGADARRAGHGEGAAGHAERQDGARARARASRRAKGEPGDLLVTFDVVVPPSARPTTSARRSRRWPRSCTGNPRRAPGGVSMAATESATGRSTSSRSRPSSPACTRRRCASTSARASSSRSAPRAAAAATPTATSRCCAASRSSPTKGVSLAGVRKILELEDELARAHARIRELQHALEQARDDLVDAVEAGAPRAPPRPRARRRGRSAPRRRPTDRLSRLAGPSHQLGSSDSTNVAQLCVGAARCAARGPSP